MADEYTPQSRSVVKAAAGAVAQRAKNEASDFLTFQATRIARKPIKAIFGVSDDQANIIAILAMVGFGLFILLLPIVLISSMFSNSAGSLLGDPTDCTPFANPGSDYTYLTCPGGQIIFGRTGEEARANLQTGNCRRIGTRVDSALDCTFGTPAASSSTGTSATGSVTSTSSGPTLPINSSCIATGFGPLDENGDGLAEGPNVTIMRCTSDNLPEQFIFAITEEEGRNNYANGACRTHPVLASLDCRNR